MTPTVIGTAKTSVNAHPITTKSTGIVAGPIEHGRQHRARDGECERDGEHGHVRPRGETSGESEAGSRRCPCHRRWRPWRAATLLPRSCARPTSYGGSSEGGAQDPVLDEPRPGRPGDRTDNDEQQRCANGAGPHRSGNHPPSPDVGAFQRPCAIDLVACRPLLHKADPA